jgi:predicted dehydrogenase
MLRIGVVGAGIGGAHGAVVQDSGIGELVAVCDRDAARLQWRVETYEKEMKFRPKGYVDFDAMLKTERLDGVIVSTPSGVHHQQAVLAAKYGVAALVDKPLDISRPNMDAIAAAVKASGVICGVNYGLRFQPALYAVKRAIDSGAFGKLLLVDLRLKWFRDQAYYDKGGWRGTWAMDGGGSLMNQGAHPIDLLTWYAGRPVRVRGDFAALNHRIETEDWAAAIVEFEGGVRSCITTTTDCFPKNDRIFIEVHGTLGSAYLVDEKLVETNVEALKQPPPPPAPNAVIDFLMAVRDRRPPMTDLTQGRRSVELILAVYESARQNRTIEL